MLRHLCITLFVFIIYLCYAAAYASPYIGINTSFNSTEWNVKHASQKTTSYHSDGVSGGVFGGYGEMVNQNLYLGVEGFANINSVNTENKVIDAYQTTVNLKSTYSYGASILPGIKAGKDTLIYARMGLIKTRFELTQNPAPNFYGAQSTTGNTVTGGQLGAGVQTGVTKHVDIRGEYVYSAYRSFSAFNNKISPNNNQVNMGLVYKIF